MYGVQIPYSGLWLIFVFHGLVLSFTNTWVLGLFLSLLRIWVWLLQFLCCYGARDMAFPVLFNLLVSLNVEHAIVETLPLCPVRLSLPLCRRCEASCVPWLTYAGHFGLHFSVCLLYFLCLNSWFLFLLNTCILVILLILWLSLSAVVFGLFSLWSL